MSFLRRLLAGSTPPQPEPVASRGLGAPSMPWSAADAPFESATIEDRFCELAHSPNGRWTLGLSDASPDGRLAGARGGGAGAWILLDGPRIAARGRLERPNDGHVADDGRFIVADWCFGDDLGGSIWAFDPDGSILVHEDLPANAGGTAIATDGSVAVATTLLNTAHPEASNRIVCYDLGAQARRWAVAGPGGWTGVEIDRTAGLVLVRWRDHASVALDLATGEVRGDWAPDAAEADNRYVATERLEAAVRAGLSGANEPTAERWLAEAIALTGRFEPEYAGRIARLARVEGEVYRALSATRWALGGALIAERKTP